MPYQWTVTHHSFPVWKTRHRHCQLLSWEKVQEFERLVAFSNNMTFFDGMATYWLLFWDAATFHGIVLCKDRDLWGVKVTREVDWGWNSVNVLGQERYKCIIRVENFLQGLGTKSEIFRRNLDSTRVLERDIGLTGYHVGLYQTKFLIRMHFPLWKSELDVKMWLLNFWDFLSDFLEQAGGCAWLLEC